MRESKGIRLAVLGLVLIALLVVGGCNKPPVITSLTPSAMEVASGGSCTVTCVVSDPNTDDTLTYAWTATAGAISGTGSTVTWTAPTTEGTYSVTVTVSDGKETVIESCNIQVVNTPPVIASLTSSATDLPPEGSCTVGCVANDADGDTLTYAWTASGGTITGTGDSITWEAPAAEDTYTINVEVSDGKGGTDSDSVDIVVEMKYGSIDIRSDPPGAAVFLNDVDTGNVTPYVITNLSPGTYDVRLEYYHYKHYVQQITVTPNETTYHSWTLEPAPTQEVLYFPGANAGKDAYVSDTEPTTNFGDRIELFAGARAAGTLRSFIQFDISGLPEHVIPENAVVTCAWLELYYFYNVPGHEAEIGVYRVLGTWTETDITWDNQPLFADAPEDTESFPASPTGAFHTLVICDLAEGWWDGSIPNYGVVLMSTNPSAWEGWTGFVSSDHSDASLRPRLKIYYYDPTS